MSHETEGGPNLEDGASQEIQTPEVDSQVDSRKRTARVCPSSPTFRVLDFKSNAAKRARYPVDYKLKAVEYARKKDPFGRGPGNTVGTTYAASRLGLSRKMLRDWDSKQEAMQKTVLDAQDRGGARAEKKANQRKALCAGRKASTVHVEDEVVSWINDMRSEENSLAVTPRMIKNLVMELDPTAFGGTPDPLDINAYQLHKSKLSNWYSRFAVRHRFSIRKVTRKGQKLPLGWEAVVRQSFLVDLRKLRTTLPPVQVTVDSDPEIDASDDVAQVTAMPTAPPTERFLLRNIVNADQTPLFLEPARNQTVQAIGSKDVAIKTGGKEKVRFTAMLAVNAAGEKLKPLIIFKGKPQQPKPGVLPRKRTVEREFWDKVDNKGEKYPSTGLAYAVQENAWHSQVVMDNVWIPKVWNQRLGASAVKSKSEETLLMWDDYLPHKSEKTLSALAETNTFVHMIPGGLTPKMQSLDGEINKVFKNGVQNLFDDWSARPGAAKDANGYPVPPSRGLIAQWAKKSWDQVDKATIMRSWKRTGALLPLDGSGDAEFIEKELNGKGGDNEEADAALIALAAAQEDGDDDREAVF